MTVATLEGRVQKHQVKKDHVIVVISGQQCPTPITLTIELCAEARAISEGDMLWFDKDKIYWTPKKSKTNMKMPVDYPILRIKGKGGSTDKDIRTATYEAHKPTHGGYGGF